nr:MAG TPA: hypothetical protein [Caudoviricetes sp.]
MIFLRLSRQYMGPKNIPNLSKRNRNLLIVT